MKSSGNCESRTNQNTQINKKKDCQQHIACTAAFSNINQSTTYGELKKMLPSTGTGRVPGITKLRETATVVLHAATQCGVVEVYDNGFYTYMENEHITVYAVDRCTVLEWYSCTGEKITSEGNDLSGLPWIMPLEIAGYNRLEHNSSSREESKAEYSLNAPASDNNLLFSVRPEHEIREEEELEEEYRQERIVLMQEAMKKLTAKQKKILCLAHLENMTQNEIAIKLHIRRTTVQEQLEAAEKKIKKFFKNTRHFTP